MENQNKEIIFSEIKTMDEYREYIRQKSKAWYKKNAEYKKQYFKAYYEKKKLEKAKESLKNQQSKYK